MTRTLALLVITAQLADLALMGLAVRAQGIGGEIGPLRAVYLAGGFGAVAAAKVAAIVVVLAILARLRSRRLALLVATVGVVGAASGLVALG
jgi:hypothetical protein